MTHERRIIIDRYGDDDQAPVVIWTYCTSCSFIGADDTIDGAMEDWDFHLKMERVSP